MRSKDGEKIYWSSKEIMYKYDSSYLDQGDVFKHLYDKACQPYEIYESLMNSGIKLTNRHDRMESAIAKVSESIAELKCQKKDTELEKKNVKEDIAAYQKFLIAFNGEAQKGYADVSDAQLGGYLLFLNLYAACFKPLRNYVQRYFELKRVKKALKKDPSNEQLKDDAMDIYLKILASDQVELGGLQADLQSYSILAYNWLKEKNLANQAIPTEEKMDEIVRNVEYRGQTLEEVISPKLIQ